MVPFIDRVPLPLLMSPEPLKVLAAGLILGAGLLGGWVPTRFGEGASARYCMRLGTAFSGGIFLGAGFIHLLPDAMRKFTIVLPGVAYPVAAVVCTLGFLLILILEQGVLRGQEETVAPGTVLTATVLTLALSIHSLIAGIALGAESLGGQVIVLLLAILAHKSAAAFALSVALHRAALPRSRVLFVLVLFACVTPGGVIAGLILSNALQAAAGRWLECTFDALAAGTFIYVATIDVIAGEAKKSRLGAPALAAVVAGLAVMATVAVWI